jgi:hypothetical protein
LVDASNGRLSDVDVLASSLSIKLRIVLELNNIFREQPKNGDDARNGHARR